MMNYRRFTRYVAPLGLLLACDPEADEAGQDAWSQAEEEVTPRCAVNGQFHFTGTLVAHPANPSLSASLTNSSPNASYGGKSCDDHYVIQATDVDNFWFHDYLVVSPFWAGPALTASQCPWTVLDYDVSIYYGGTWHQRVASFDVGSWSGSHCVIGGPVQIYDPGNQAEKVQVAVRAKYLDGSGEHFGKVGASIIKTDILFE